MSTSSEQPQHLSQKMFYQGRKFAFDVSRLRLPNGAEGEWECVRHPGGALAVPVTPDGKFVLVRQYRFAAEQRLLEFPAGTVEPNEDPFTTVEREIQEETGFRAHRWQNLGQFYLAPGYSDEIIYAYLALDLEPLEHPPAQDEDEDIELVLMTAQELEQAIFQGAPIDAKSICSFMLAQKALQQSADG
ncbi:NUDIX hydrolase [Leptolyngbya sp. AN02str]|uniref:NUDIX hydrolase n=1 Tax=Leptolyngbya sp. AN02str TaxID=3423363 RepID=UPI003D3174C1